MSYVLIPGRHHLLSNFQQECITYLINNPPEQILDLEGYPLGLKDSIDTVIWAVTGANHSNTRRNPIPGHRREVAIERFGDQFDATTFVYQIDDLGHTPRFAEYLLKKIAVDSLGKHELTPENCVVAVSTPSVIKMYQEMGFQIMPLELEDFEKGTYGPLRTWQIIERLVEAGKKGEDWRTDKTFLMETAKASRDLFFKYDYGDLIIELFNDPILGDDGDITETRNYSEYVRAFDEGAERKYTYLKPYIKSGRIVDIGCATGSIIKQMSEDDAIRESDLFGIEVSRKLYSLCVQRKENGEFLNDNVFFYQRNIIDKKIFTDNSINTFTALSVAHELESYAGRDVLLKFLQRIYEQLLPGGVFITYDVIGPSEKEREVYMELSRDDGESDGWDMKFDKKQSGELQTFLESLSTYAKFLRFAQDFRAEEGYSLKYEAAEIDGKTLVKLKLSDAAEFMSKKDYTDNWYSEMHETFCFWNFEDWKENLKKIGFVLNWESRVMTNKWIVENRLKGRVRLFEMHDGALNEIEYPPTNVVLVAEKI